MARMSLWKSINNHPGELIRYKYLKSIYIYSWFQPENYPTNPNTHFIDQYYPQAVEQPVEISFNEDLGKLPNFVPGFMDPWTLMIFIRLG